MKPLPSDPVARHTRFIDALIQDWTAAGRVTRDTPRADAVLHLCREGQKPIEGAEE